MKKSGWREEESTSDIENTRRVTTVVSKFRELLDKEIQDD